MEPAIEVLAQEDLYEERIVKSISSFIEALAIYAAG